MVHDSDIDQVVAQVQTKMVLRGLAPLTIETYVRCIRRFITRVGKPLAAVKAQDVEQYLLDMTERTGAPAGTARWLAQLLPPQCGLIGARSYFGTRRGRRTKRPVLDA